MTEIHPSAFCEALEQRGLEFFCGVPDSLLKDLCSHLLANVPSNRHVIAANEGNAVAMACGWHVATGRAAVVYMQNSGEGNAVNPLLSLADPDVYSIPMLLVIGWRGEPGVPDEPQHLKQGKATLALLDAMGVPYEVLDIDRWREQISSLEARMRIESRPVALVVRKGALSSSPLPPSVEPAPLTREAMLELLLDSIGSDDIVVATTGKTSRELFEARERRGQGHARDFLTVGGMGHTCSIALGMALGSDRTVWCVDGDGSFLMHMGSLAVAGAMAPDTLKYVLNDNGAHESVGGFPTAGRSVDIAGILRACGFETTSVSAELDAREAFETMREPGRKALVVRTRQGSRRDLGCPDIAPKDNKLAMIDMLTEGAGSRA
ncbi:phosphonopyruvate decarboxylase [Gordonibacter sp. An230]|uniref:phosphonopyruvate decarboxylase n=1 Tax=Gordonibacter sp. An230 TaxID=1965592 RepID=UPI000B3B03FD|nr:phosphonopyruvate decarboxylase [Gordonibacter sp. An230]OUO90682.1 phosphonopyruvate decarboxylase [Gordonibacter sp. An230]